VGRLRGEFLKVLAHAEWMSYKAGQGMNRELAEELGQRGFITEPSSGSMDPVYKFYGQILEPISKRPVEEIQGPYGDSLRKRLIDAMVAAMDCPAPAAAP
jgi:hypothetical protein